jgi:uncharacterized membrane protein
MTTKEKISLYAAAGFLLLLLVNVVFKLLPDGTNRTCAIFTAVFLLMYFFNRYKRKQYSAGKQ